MGLSPEVTPFDSLWLKGWKALWDFNSNPDAKITLLLLFPKLEILSFLCDSSIDPVFSVVAPMLYIGCASLMLHKDPFKIPLIEFSVLYIGRITIYVYTTCGQIQREKALNYLPTKVDQVGLKQESYSLRTNTYAKHILKK